MANARNKDETRTAAALRNTAAAVVCGCEGPEAAGIAKQLAELKLQEVIMVLEEADAALFAALRAVPGVTLVHVPDRLGPDGCREAGAKLASAETVLFVDGRLPAVEGAVLKRLLAAVDSGADVALPDVVPQLGAFKRWSDVYRIRAFVNWSLGRPDLRASAVAGLPHAWSREAIAAVGADKLAVPALAHQAAIRQGLRIAICPFKRLDLETAHSSDTDRRSETGDCFEALSEAMAAQGSRLALADRYRRRQAVGGESG